MSDGLSGINLELVDSVSQAERLMSWLSERRPGTVIAIDTETGERAGRPKDDAFSPWHGRLRLAQIGDGMTGWAIPWEGWSGVFLEAMRKWEGRVLLHNSTFDLRYLTIQSDWAIPWHKIDDSMIAAQIIHPLHSAALKSLTAKHVDARAAQLQDLLHAKMADNGWTWGTIPITCKEYWAYGCLDTVLTCRLWDTLKLQVGPGGPYQKTYELEMAARRICTEMELNGSRVNLDYCQQMYDEQHQKAEKIKDWGAQTYDGANLNSSAQMIEVFTNQLGAEITERTPGGSPKLDKDQLKKFVIDWEGGEVAILAQQILAMKKSYKIADSYFKNFLTMNVDGLLHPDINTLGARTGRMSIRKPALQTLHKGEKLVRQAFIPRNENEVILTSDLDQVEFRLTALLSGDSGLLALFNRCDATNGDAFTEIMREVYADPTAVKSDPRRKLIKAYVYATLYGAGLKKMALTAGVPEPTMKELSDAFNSRYPGVKQFSRSVEHAGMTRFREEGEGYVRTQTGRRLPCDEGKVYTLTNYLIQSTAAEVFKYNLVKLDAAGLSPYMMVPVHDEIVLSVPRELATDIKYTVQACMTTSDFGSAALPLTAGIDGPFDNWGEAVED